MRKALLVLIAGTVLVGAGAPTAIATTGEPQPDNRPATKEEWTEFGQELAELEATLATAESMVLRGRIGGWRYRECQFQSLRKGTWTQQEERLTSACAVEKWHVPGGLDKFMSEGYCESGFNRKAYNPNGHVGLFQHDADSYVSRVNTYEPNSWDAELSRDWKNSRGHIVMTVRYVHANGWGAWDQYNDC